MEGMKVGRIAGVAQVGLRALSYAVQLLTQYMQGATCRQSSHNAKQCMCTPTPGNVPRTVKMAASFIRLASAAALQPAVASATCSTTPHTTTWQRTQSKQLW